MLVPTFRRAAWLLSLPSFVTAVHCGSDAASPGASTDGGTTVPDAAIVDAQASDSGRDAGPDASRDGATTGDAATLPAAANVHLAAGGAHTCAILTGGVLKCWGYNGYGQLGLGDTKTRGAVAGTMGANLPAVSLGAGRSAVSVAVGDMFTCAILDNAQVKCWGYNFGQLGLGDTQNRGDAPGEMGDALPAVDLGAGRTAKSITAGGTHACAVLDDGSLKCWGYNAFGQLGLGDSRTRGDGPGEMGNALPVVDVGPGRRVLAVEAGWRRTCARLDDGTAKCWGANDGGTLGLGDSTSRGMFAGQMGAALPTLDFGPGARVVGLGVGHYTSTALIDFSHACALLEGGALKCWGGNYAGELGIGDLERRGDAPGEMGSALPPVGMGAGRTVLQISSGEAFNCARLDNGQVKCWGANASGQLGLGDTTNRGGSAATAVATLPPVDLGTGRTVTDLAVGGRHACARLDNDAIRCWGENGDGELGLGNTTNRGDAAGQLGDALPVVSLQ